MGSGCCLGRGSTSLQSHLFRCIFIHILSIFIISSSHFHLIIIVAFNENDILKETIMICWRNIKLQNGVLQSYRVVPLFMQEPTACIQAASDLTNPEALTLPCVHCKAAPSLPLTIFSLICPLSVPSSQTASHASRCSYHRSDHYQMF